MKKYMLYKVNSSTKSQTILYIWKTETSLKGATFNSYSAYPLRISDLLQSWIWE